jgi:hypothetical protein
MDLWRAQTQYLFAQTVKTFTKYVSLEDIGSLEAGSRRWRFERGQELLTRLPELRRSWQPDCPPGSRAAGTTLKESLQVA